MIATGHNPGNSGGNSTGTANPNSAEALPGSVMQHIMSINAAARGNSNSGNNSDVVTINGKTYRACIHNVQYKVSNANLEKRGALIDSGANGGICGKDMRVISTITGKAVDVVGIEDHKVESLELCHAAGVVKTSTGKEICAHFHQYANMGVGESIHSVAQLEAYGMIVDTTSKKQGGQQMLKHMDGWVVPLAIRNGMA